MYDLPEVTSATSAWWSGLAGHMRREGLADVPDTLHRPVELVAHWRSPALLFSQTCGYPLTHALRGAVQLVALPVYGCDGCTADGFYSSVVVVPASSAIHSLTQCRNRRAVFNTPDSMSGLLALRHAVSMAVPASDEGSGFFNSLTESGGHRRSLEAVAAGQADVAAIDAVTFALLSRNDPQLVAGVRVVGHTRQVPGLPYITAARASHTTVTRLRAAVRQAFADPSLAEARAELLLSGVRFPDPSSYDVILEVEAEAVAMTLA